MRARGAEVAAIPCGERVVRLRLEYFLARDFLGLVEMFLIDAHLLARPRRKLPGERRTCRRFCMVEHVGVIRRGKAHRGAQCTGQIPHVHEIQFPGRAVVRLPPAQKLELPVQDQMRGLQWKFTACESRTQDPAVAIQPHLCACEVQPGQAFQHMPHGFIAISSRRGVAADVEALLAIPSAFLDLQHHVRRTFGFAEAVKHVGRVITHMFGGSSERQLGKAEAFRGFKIRCPVGQADQPRLDDLLIESGAQRFIGGCTDGAS